MPDFAPPTSASSPGDEGEPAAGVASSCSPSAARRIYGLTCNLLATGLILIAAVVFPRQILDWWRADEPSVAAALNDQELSAPLDPSQSESLNLVWGDWPYELQRREFSGDRKAMRDELQRVCRAAAAHAQIDLSAPAGPAEEQLLKMLVGDASSPAASSPGDQIFLQDGPITLVAAVRTGDAESIAPGAARPARPVVAAARRVVSWGMGVHLAGTRWTLLVLTARGGPPSGCANELEVPLPESARRVVSLAAGGTKTTSTITVFSGQGSVAHWQRHFDDALPAAAAQVPVQSDWRRLGQVWHKRYESATRVIDVHIGAETQAGRHNGYLHISNKTNAAP